jgi:hypothetical protein
MAPKGEKKKKEKKLESQFATLEGNAVKNKINK